MLQLSASQPQPYRIITDSKGAVVPSATVVVRNRTSIERTTQSDTEKLSGSVITLQPRDRSEGKWAQDPVGGPGDSGVAQTIVQNFQLEIGALSEQVCYVRRTGDRNATTSVAP